MPQIPAIRSSRISSLSAKFHECAVPPPLTDRVHWVNKLHIPCRKIVDSVIHIGNATAAEADTDFSHTFSGCFVRLRR